MLISSHCTQNWRKEVKVGKVWLWAEFPTATKEKGGGKQREDERDRLSTKRQRWTRVSPKKEHQKDILS